MKKGNIKSGGSGMYMPFLVVLLLIAVFFVGRLSSQVEMMSDSGVVKERVADNGGGVGDQEGGSPIDVSGLKVMAKELSLNQKEFDSCLDEGKFEQRISDDLSYGNEVKVSGTPTFFINEVMVVGSQPAEIFEAVIDFELAGGDWSSPSEAAADLVDGNPSNGEVSITDGVEVGVGAIKGGNDARIKIVEFSDFECPFCARTVPVIEGLFEKYGDEISLEYRHYPLAFHLNAQKAGEASECAGEQGKFWEMHDMIFEAQG